LVNGIIGFLVRLIQSAISGKWTRRRFLTAAVSLLGAPLLVAVDAKWIEPTWVKIRHLRLSKTPTHRIVHFTDIHHKGDRDYLLSVVNKINALSPDFVCFTGDLIEEKGHVPEALEALSKIQSPLYGVPGNHDYWCKANFGDFEKCFAATGGDFLIDKSVVTRDGKITLHGAGFAGYKAGRRIHFKANPATKSILLIHFPAWADAFPEKYDLILAGHSHGGQVRIPFYGAFPFSLPHAVKQYQMGLYATASGPLYVNPGIGWFMVPVRFNCRPELTVFEI